VHRVPVEDQEDLPCVLPQQAAHELDQQLLHQPECIQTI